MAVQPDRDIDQRREDRRMAFGKAVFSETLDLVEAAVCDSGWLTAFYHAPDHQVFQLANGAARPERGHGLAKHVRLDWGKARGEHDDLHRLMLKDRHTQWAAKNLSPFVRGTITGRGPSLSLIP